MCSNLELLQDKINNVKMTKESNSIIYNQAYIQMTLILSVIFFPPDKIAIAI